jgi:quinoprotein glucose dehydrogenase
MRLITALVTLTLLGGCAPSQDENRAAVLARQSGAAPAAREWRSYLGDPASNQYSPLAQINRDNVAQLAEAWRYDPGDADEYGTLIPTNPLVVKGVLYGLSARKNLFALDAATGEELWVHRFDRPREGKGAGRGLVYWAGRLADGSDTQLILVGLGHQLFAVDALTGRIERGFGDDGQVDLRPGLDRPADQVSVSANTPGTVFDDLLIMGFATGESYDASPGYIRAYHLPSGELRWTFRTIPAPGEFGADTWPEEYRLEFGGANAWAGITLDRERGLAFVPTGSAGDDFYGSNRRGDNLFANSLVALDARTGQRVWHYQFIRHDLWDRDLPTPPNLVTVMRDGQPVPAVSQATKTGHLFVFHRETGEPLFDIEEIPVQGDGVPGEHPPASQPLPVAPPPFASQVFRVTGRSAAAAAAVEGQVDGMRRNHPFMIPDEAGIVLYPGMDGGAEWGGQAWDANTGLLYVNTNEMPYFHALAPTRGRLEVYSLENGYRILCSGCHGAQRQGMGEAVPSLLDIGERYWPWQTYRIIRHGRARMPALRDQPWWVAASLAGYLHFTGPDSDADISQQKGQVTGYAFTGYNRLLDHEGLPGSEPPWGSLVAIDVSAGEIAWKIPLGDYPAALAQGLSGLGAENYGGPVVTASGLLFIAATPDSRIRAFDAASGELLWQAQLPAAGFATPAVYEADGRQFVVIAAGGGKLGGPSGSAYVAYALPTR